MIERSLPLALLVWFVPALAWAQPPNDCMETETEAECHARLQCLPNEDIETCKRRRAGGATDGQQDPNRDDRDDRDDRDRDRDRDDSRRDRDRDDDRDRAQERDRRERERRRKERERKRRDRDDDDDDDRDSGGGGGGSDVIRPGTRPWFFAGAIGPTFFGLNRNRVGFRGGVEARARVALDFGYHLDGEFEGPALGGTVEQTFSDADTFYVINPAFKFWWDIQVVDEYGIYIAPFGKAGYAGALCGERRFGCPYHAFNIGFGAEGRLILNDRGLVLLRPIQLDTYLGDFFNETFWLNYSVLIGGGVIW